MSRIDAGQAAVDRIDIVGPSPRLRSYQFTGTAELPGRVIAD
ncbi:hypothetical protein [Streptomyces sp. YGL11-2]